ncbi:MAG: ABC transporter permease [Lachnospiraceae bacterium]|nr:ABC transporter permease [Lachnospiraceae bacterium]
MTDRKIKIRYGITQILGSLGMALFLILIDAFSANATEANLLFENNEYSVKVNDTFKVPVTIKADGNIGYYEIVLKYDKNRMQYVSGAEAEDNGLVTLQGTGWGDEITYSNLRFKATSGGSAGLVVKEAHIFDDSEEIEDYVLGETPEIHIEIEGTDNGKLPFFEQLVVDERMEATLETYGIVTDAPVIGSIKKGDETLYVVDMADYTPDINIWDYKLITDLYMGVDMTYITDNAMNVRVIPAMDSNGKYTILAYNTGNGEIYPIKDITVGGIDGKRFFLMSIKACQNIPQNISEEDIGTETIFYAIDHNGEGDFYRFTADGELEKWDSSYNPNLENIVDVLKIVAIVVVAINIALFIALLIIKRRGVMRRVKKQWTYMKDGVVDRKQYLFVIRELTSREIKRKYARSYLGIVWSVLSPMLHMIVMTLVFSYMFKNSIERFPLYYLTGNIFWSLFSTATNHAMTALVDNKTLLLKAKLPKQTFVLSRVYTSLVNFGYTFITYVLMLIVFRIKPSFLMLLFPLDLLLAMIFATGVGYILSIMYVFFADIKYLYDSVFLTMLMYLSALFYPVTRLPSVLQKVLGYNPVYLSIYIARECMVYHNVPHWSAWLKLTLYAFASVTIGYIVFKKKQNDVMQKI